MGSCPSPASSSFAVICVPSFPLDKNTANTGIGRAGYDLHRSSSIYFILKISALLSQFFFDQRWDTFRERRRFLDLYRAAGT